MMPKPAKTISFLLTPVVTISGPMQSLQKSSLGEGFFVLWTEKPSPNELFCKDCMGPDIVTTGVNKNDIVFAGFGIIAPEYNWNDYAGLDVRGKTVLVMVNDPGFYDSTLFKGHTMTYYGRWT